MESQQVLRGRQLAAMVYAAIRRMGYCETHRLWHKPRGHCPDCVIERVTGRTLVPVAEILERVALGK